MNIIQAKPVSGSHIVSGDRVTIDDKGRASLQRRKARGGFGKPELIQIESIVIKKR